MEITVARLREILKDIDWEIQVDSIDETLPLRDQGLDSLDMVTLFFALEERLSIRIPDSETSGLLSLKDIAEHVNSEMKR